MTTNREAQLLEASRYATPAEQRRIQAELATIRRGRTAAIQQDRELDLGASVTEHLKPVFVHSMHTAATDWLDEVAPDFTQADLGRVARDVRVAAEGWFRGVNPVVRRESTEFGEQLRGTASREASQYGTLAPQARQIFTSHVAKLYRLAEGTDMAGVPSAAGDSSNPDLTAWKAEESTDAGSPPGYENPPGIDTPTEQVGDDGGSGESNPTDSSPNVGPAVDPDDLLDVTDANNAAGSTQAEVAQDTVTAGYHGSLIATRARHFLAVEEGQPFPVPGESDPEQSGEAGTTLPRAVEPTDAPEVFDNFIDFNKDDPAAVSSERARNISANSARRTAADDGDGDDDDPPYKDEEGDFGDDDIEKQPAYQEWKKTQDKESARRFASWVGEPDPFLVGSPDRQGRTATFHTAEEADFPAKCGRTDVHGAHMSDKGFCVGNKGPRIVEQPTDDVLRERAEAARHTANDDDDEQDREVANGDIGSGDADYTTQWRKKDHQGPGPKFKEGVATGPNPYGSTVYDGQAATDQGYKEGFKYALTFTPGKPVPAAVSSSATLGEKYNSQYVVGYRSGLSDGIATLDAASQAAWQQAVTSAIQVASSKTATGPNESDKDGWNATCGRCGAGPFGPLEFEHHTQEKHPGDYSNPSKTARDFSQSERDKDAASGAAESDGSFPIENAKDLSNAKADLGRAGDKPSDVAHVNERAKALGEPGVGESKESSMQRQSEALPQLELADMDDTPSNPLTWSGEGNSVDGKGAADVADVKTPGSAPADYPQPNGGEPEPAIGEDPADAWVGADASVDSEKTAAFRRTVQASLRG